MLYRFKVVFILFLTTAFISVDIYGQQDDILEALDMKLENLPLNEDDYSRSDNKNNYTPRPSRTEVKGRIDLDKNIQKTNDALQVISNRIAETSSKVEQLKQALIQRSEINNFIKIDLNIENQNNSGIQSVNAKLDNITIYESYDQNNLWLPEAKLPIFYGPLVSGDHQLDIQIRIISLNKNKLKSTDNNFSEIQERFNLSIPEGESSQHWQIKLDSKNKIASFINKGNP